MLNDRDQRMLIGPDQPLDDQPSMLIEDARRRLKAAEKHDREGAMTARRLMVAFALMALLAALSFVFLPKWGIHLPPIIPVLGFAVIVIGAVLGSGGVSRPKKRECDAEGSSVCCDGPRPLRLFRDE